MRRRIVSSIVTLAVVAGVIGGYQLTRSDGGGYEVTADVEQAPNLFSGGRVMVRGVEVGTITDVEPSPDGVRITMTIDEGIKVPADARLTIVPITVIADRYVQLYPAYKAGATLAGGDHIPLDRTSIPAELDDVLTQLKGLLAALEPEPGEAHGPLARLIRQFDKVLRGRSDALAGTIEGSASVLENLANSETEIRGLVTNLDRLFVALANRASDIGLLNERFQLVAESLAGDQENVEGTIENLAFLSDEAASLILESGDELGESFGRLEKVLDAVLVHQDSLAKAMKWANVSAQALGETDASGRGRFAYTGRQAAPGSPRAVYNYRIDSRDTIACERIGALVESFLVLNPEATVEEVRNTVLNFIPDFYRDDITFLLDLLIPICADLPGESSLDDKSQAVIRKVAAQVGEERFGAMLARWFLQSVTEESR